MNSANIYAHPDLLTALRDYARANGKQWRKALRSEWENGTASEAMQRVRNTIGPKALDQVPGFALFTAA